MSKLCRDCACENVCGITHTPNDTACEFYKADAVTEFEKVKTDLLELEFNFHYDWFTVKHNIEIIDNYIAELKGENNADNKTD